MRRIQLLLTLGEDARLADFECRLSEVAASVSAAPAGKLAVTASVRLADDPTPTTVLGQTVVGTAQHRFDGMFSIDSESADFEYMIELLKIPTLRLGDLIDQNWSAAVAGTVHLIVPGHDHLLFLYPLRRRSELTREQFLAYWLNVHSEHGRRAPGLHGYRQLHADEGATAIACSRLGLGISDLDGVAESANSDIENFLKVMSTAVTAGVGADDTSVFIDQNRSAVFLTRVLTPISEVSNSD